MPHSQNHVSFRQILKWIGAILAVTSAALDFILDEMSPEPQNCTTAALLAHATFIEKFKESVKEANTLSSQDLNRIAVEMVKSRDDYSKVEATGCTRQVQLTLIAITNCVISAETLRQNNAPHPANSLSSVLRDFATASNEFQNPLTGRLCLDPRHKASVNSGVFQAFCMCSLAGPAKGMIFICQTRSRCGH
jgi:hypothetical protein